MNQDLCAVCQPVVVRVSVFRVRPSANLVTVRQIVIVRIAVMRVCTPQVFLEVGKFVVVRVFGKAALHSVRKVQLEPGQEERIGVVAVDSDVVDEDAVLETSRIIRACYIRVENNPS